MADEPKTSLTESIIEASNVLTKFSVPLYVNDDNGRPIQYGTGFFVRVQGTHFLVSAAHVLDEVRTKRVFYYATPKTLRTLTGKVLTTASPEERGHDLLDVGVLKMVGDSVPPYPEVDKFAMELEYLNREHRPRSGKHYVIIGFPASKSRVDNIERNVLVTPYAYRSDSIDEGQYRLHGVDPATHVVLPLDLRKTFDVDGRRTPQMAAPRGMSGSPITVLYDVDKEADASRVFPVVAVGTTYRTKTKVLVGTDVRFALEMIAQHLRG